MNVPLAHTIDGDSFSPPNEAVAWRVKRLRQGKGAPELVYGENGTPLVVPLECTPDEFREAVPAPGRYRLDAVDEHGRTLRDAAAAYVWVHPDAAPTTAPPPVLDTNAVIVEALRKNTELAQSIVVTFPAMLESAACLMRAADGAGLYRRDPTAAHTDETDGAEPAPTVAGFDLNGLLAQIVPALLMSLGGGKGKLPSVAEMLDWRQAARAAEAEAPASTRKEIPAAAAEASTPTLSPKLLAHFAAVQSALRPEEAALARATAAELSPAELRSWMEVVGELEVDEAVAHIRAELAKVAKQEPVK